MSNNSTNHGGYIALSTILIVSFVVLALSTTVSQVAIGEGQSSLALVRGEETMQFVDGCVEDALLKARANASYNGGTFTRPEGTCVVMSPITKVGNTWTMDTTTQNSTYKKTVRTVFTRIGVKITVLSRLEL